MIAIAKFLEGRSGGSSKVPRQAEFRDELPKGPTGKILKRALREK